MKTEPTHIVCISKRRLGRDWQGCGETRSGEIVFRTIDHDELPLAIGRDVFYNAGPCDRTVTFSRDNPRETLRRLSVAKVISIDWNRRRVTLQEAAIKLTIPISDVAAVGGRL
jgi:hypothetical protein